MWEGKNTCPGLWCATGSEVFQVVQKLEVEVRCMCDEQSRGIRELGVRRW